MRKIERETAALDQKKTEHEWKEHRCDEAWLSSVLTEVSATTEPRLLTVSTLVALTVAFDRARPPASLAVLPMMVLEGQESISPPPIELTHELPILLVLDQCQKALMGQTLGQHVELLGIWVDTIRDREAVEEEMRNNKSTSWSVTTRVCDLDAAHRRPPPADATLHELERLLHVFEQLEGVETMQCRTRPNHKQVSPNLTPMADLVKALAPFRRSPNPPLIELLPWMNMMRRSGGINRGSATLQERAQHDELSEKLRLWEERHPVVARYIDPPHVIMIPAPAPLVVGLAAIEASVNAARFAPDPIDATAGNIAISGVKQLTGDHRDARWYADLLRSYYADGSGNGGPQPAHHIMSFTTTANGALQFH